MMVSDLLVREGRRRSRRAGSLGRSIIYSNPLPSLNLKVNLPHNHQFVQPIIDINLQLCYVNTVGFSTDFPHFSIFFSPA